MGFNTRCWENVPECARQAVGFFYLFFEISQTNAMRNVITMSLVVRRWSIKARVHCTGSRACEACRDPRITKADPGVANRKRYHAAPKDLGENAPNVAQKSQEPVKERKFSL